MNISKVRDLTLIKISDSEVMVIACDSCGSIGSKEMDELKVPPFFVGKFTSRVTIMEVIAAGAEIVTLANAVCCEMEPTGKEIIRGIREELLNAGINDAVLTGSTEENFKTLSTAVGITSVGIVNKHKLRVNNIKKPCKLISIGVPKVGAELQLEEDKDISSYKDLKFLMEQPEVYEIVPVGSKGILFEAKLLAGNNNLKIELYDKLNVDIYKTCGPATVLVAAVEDCIIEDIKQNINNVNVIGNIVSK